MARRSNETEEVTVKCICGHDEVFTITKYKNPGNRTSKIEELEERLCRACFFTYTIEEYGLVELRVPYTIYKTGYRGCLVDWNSYDAESKMISVWVRKEHVSDEELLARIVRECGLTERQAWFLITCSWLELRAIGEWVSVSEEENAGLAKAVEMIDSNDPRYEYAEWHRPNTGEDAGVDSLGVLDGAEVDDLFVDGTLSGDELPF